MPSSMKLFLLMLFLPVSFVYSEEGVAHEMPMPHRRTQGESPMRNGEDT